VAKIKDLIERAEKLYNSGVNEPEFKSWKDDAEKYLKKIYGETSSEAAAFENIEYYKYYLTFDLFNGGWRENILKEKDTFQKGIKTAVFYLKSYEADDHVVDFEKKEQKAKNKSSDKAAAAPEAKKASNKKIFFVHGRNDGVKTQVADFLLKTGIKPVNINKNIGKDQPLMEKMAKHSDVKASIVLFSSAAGQNVIFEAGYFIGKLGMEHTVILLEEGVETPSELNGCAFYEIDQKGKWRLEIANKLKSMNFDIVSTV